MNSLEIYFSDLHHKHLNGTTGTIGLRIESCWNTNPIIHVYAEPHFTGEDSGFESDIWEWNEVLAWYDKIRETKQLIRRGFIEYIHPEIQTKNYYDICHIEKNTFDYEDARVGQIYPAIIYTHNQTILTIAIVDKREQPDMHPYLLYIYYPCAETKKDFEDFEKRRMELIENRLEI